MKRVAIVIFIFLVLFSACATAGRDIDSQIMPLDQVILEIAEHLENTLEEGSVVALLNFSSPKEAFSTYVLDELSDRLVNGGKLLVVNRSELDLIRQEESFQLSGDVSDATAVSIGQKVGAQVIVSGSLTDIGRSYRVRVRVLSVETAIILASRSGNIDSREDMVKVLLNGSTPIAEAPKQTAQHSLPTQRSIPVAKAPNQTTQHSLPEQRSTPIAEAPNQTTQHSLPEQRSTPITEAPNQNVQYSLPEQQLSFDGVYHKEKSITVDDYLPAHMVSQLPVFNEIQITAALIYPANALRAGVGGRVILELYADSEGIVQYIRILREEPKGYGFGEESVRACLGMRGKPAQLNGRAVASRYRYPLTFSIR